MTKNIFLKLTKIELGEKEEITLHKFSNRTYAENAKEVFERECWNIKSVEILELTDEELESKYYQNYKILIKN